MCHSSRWAEEMRIRHTWATINRQIMVSNRYIHTRVAQLHLHSPQESMDLLHMDSLNRILHTWATVACTSLLQWLEDPIQVRTHTVPITWCTSSTWCNSSSCPENKNSTEMKWPLHNLKSRIKFQMKRLCPASWNWKATSLTTRLARRDRREQRIAIRRVSLTTDTEGTAGTSTGRSQERETSLFQTRKTTLKTHHPSPSARKARLRGLILITKDIKMKTPSSSRWEKTKWGLCLCRSTLQREIGKESIQESSRITITTRVIMGTMKRKAHLLDNTTTLQIFTRPKSRCNSTWTNRWLKRIWCTQIIKLLRSELINILITLFNIEILNNYS